MKYYSHILNFIYAIVIGAVGSILLVMFFIGVTAIGAVLKLLPFVIEFNAALTGYNLVCRTKNRFKHKRLWGLISGIVVVIFAVLILNVAFYYYTGAYFVYMANFLFLVFIGGLFSWLGAILAIRYLKLGITK